jgi:hypothetical protein
VKKYLKTGVKIDMEWNPKLGQVFLDSEIQGGFGRENTTEQAISVGRTHFLILRDEGGDGYQIIQAQ